MNALKLAAVFIPALLMLADVARADDPLATWTWRNPLPTGADLVAVAYGNGKYVALGSDGAAAISTNGVSWMQGDQVKTPTDWDAFTGLAYGNGQFAAVAWDYDEQSMAVFSSLDGMNWIRRLSGPRFFTEGGDAYRIAYGNGQFVILPYVSWDVGATSPDGINWDLTQRGATIIEEVEAVTYGNGQFVAVGAYGAIATSTNGVDWVQRHAVTTNWLSGIAYGNGQFVAVGFAIEPNYLTPAILTSSDGVNWVQRQPGTSYDINSVAYGNGEFVVVGETILTSNDGVNWVERPWPSGTRSTLLGITCGDTECVAVGEYGTVLTSSTVTNWTQRAPNGPQEDLRGAAYGGGQFVTVGNFGTVLTSADGVNWVKRASNMTNDLLAIAYRKGKFVAVGGAGIILASTSGTQWAPAVSGTSSDLNGIVQGNGELVAVGAAGTIVTSVDGSNWFQRVSGTHSELAAITYGNGCFVAVGSSGAIVISTNAVNWEAFSLTTNLGLYAVAYGHGVFVASGYVTNNGGPVMLLSGDGVNWTLQAGGDVADITYASGQFVAVGAAGGILTSPDGVNWLGRHGQYAFPDLSAVAYGNSQFVVFGKNGTILGSGRLNFTLTLDLDPGSSRLRLSLNGPTGLAYTVQSSTDLVSWDNVTNFTSVQSTTVVLGALTPISAHCFYRAISH